MTPTPQQQAVDHAITSRRSIRAFLPNTVDRRDIEEILRVASRAPSGSNTQPWKVYVLTNEPLREMTDEIVDAFLHPDPSKHYTEQYRYYPDQWHSPYQERRRAVGLALYQLLGLGKEDKAGMREQHARNFKFFDAPVGLVFSIDASMNTGSYIDFGCFLQNIMTAARARGLDTCPQAAFNAYHSIIRKHAKIPESEVLMCCMALGVADPSKVENTLVSEREPVENFARFIG
jgi:nitroreductase